MAEAARGGHLATLEWGQKSGCQILDCVVIQAAERGHTHVLEWVRVHGRLNDLAQQIAARHATQSGQIKVLEWLDAPTCDRPLLDVAIDYNQKEAARWHLDRGATPRYNTAWQACFGADRRLVALLCEYRDQWCRADAARMESLLALDR